jgi:retron-type reverse transcriptase
MSAADPPPCPAFPSLLAAWRKAAHGKRRRGDVCAFEERLAENLVALEEALAGGTWRPGPYRCFERVENGKRRLIAAAPFRDRVVHHALVEQLEPTWERRFPGWLAANRVGRGTHFALRLAQDAARRCTWVLQLDVARFFPSIDHGVVMDLLEKDLHGSPLLELWRRVLDSGKDIFPELARPALAPGDDLLALTRPRGLPIGNQTSQFLANVVLHEVDRAISHRVKPEAACRYVDDLVLLDRDRGKLEEALPLLTETLAGLRMRFQPDKTRLAATREGFTFVGYRILPWGTRLPRAFLSRAHRRLHEAQRACAKGEARLEQARAVVAGLSGHALPAGAEAAMESLFEAHPFSFPEKSPGSPPEGGGRREDVPR